MHTINGNGRRPQPPSPELLVLQRIEHRLERLERVFDEAFRLYLETRFPHGQPVDRWARGRRRA